MKGWLAFQQECLGAILQRRRHPSYKGGRKLATEVPTEGRISDRGTAIARSGAVLPWHVLEIERQCLWATASQRVRRSWTKQAPRPLVGMKMSERDWSYVG